MFTCVDRFPIGWTENESIGSEEQCLATSSDGGLTWQKYAGNPVLTHPPDGWNFTGWRDPYFHAMPELDAVLGYEEPHSYLVLGSGIHGAGPRMPLYTALAGDLTNWTYLGALFDVAGNYSWGDDAFRTGSLGYNFELAGLNSLVELEEHGGDGSTRHYFVNMGTEGGNNTFHPNAHWSMYALGGVSKRSNGSVQFDVAVSAPLDWGNLYAATSFLDSKNDRRVLWGWSDEDMNGYAIVPQGFQGSLGLPRELFIMKTHNVVAPPAGILKGPEIWTPTANDRYTVTTLGTRPLPDVVEALHVGNGTSFGSVSISGIHILDGVKGDHFHVRASLIPGPSTNAGFIVRASPGMEE
ncbi:hypothetical protein LTR04_001781 [Oleoguttula sp. CCFEE 6159]|nr:hypothetical protein LTR04_001781 [Oleoguttula sp. CCFEE 6159]